MLLISINVKGAYGDRMNIVSIDWQLTSICNRKCGFCFGPLQGSAMLDKKLIFSVVDMFQSVGVKQIGLTGGEPLLCPGINDILGYIHDKDMFIYLSTNCDFYNIHKDIIKEKVKILGVPLDGSTEVIHAKHRGGGNYVSVTNALDDILGHDISLKIGTVITKYNYKDLANIEYLISKYDEALKYWKLYDMVIYNRMSESAEKMFINPDCYNSSINLLGRVIDINKIVYHSLEKRDRSYFLIRPNGDVFIPQLSAQKSHEILLGNIITMPINTILDRWNEYINTDGYLQGYRYYVEGL